MDEYIEREALLKILRGTAVAKYPASFSFGLFAAADEISKMKAADVAPAVHGRWVRYDTDSWKCSVCGEEDAYAYSFQLHRFTDIYCPNCGARMDGE